MSVFTNHSDILSTDQKRILAAYAKGTERSLRGMKMEEKIQGLPRKFNILCARDFDRTRFLRVRTTEWVKRKNGLHQVHVRGLRAKGEAEVKLAWDSQSGIPIPRTAVMFDFKGDGQLEESKLISVETDSAGSIVALVVERYWRFGPPSDGSHMLYTDLRTALADHKSWRASKVSSRRNKEELRWSDENPPLSRKETLMSNEERRRLTREEKLRLGDQSSPVWRAYAESILGSSLESKSSSMAFQPCLFCVKRHISLQKDFNEKRSQRNVIG